MDWYALFCEQQKESYANEMLRARRFTTLFPHIPEWKALKTEARTRLYARAYYPRYLFVLSELKWLGRAMVPGVIGPVRSTDRIPFRIAQEAIQAIWDKCDPLGAIHQIPASRSKYGLLRAYRGDRVKFNDSNPLWNLAATIADVDGADFIATMGSLKVRFRSDQIGTLESRGNKRANGPTRGAV